MKFILQIFHVLPDKQFYVKNVYTDIFLKGPKKNSRRIPVRNNGVKIYPRQTFYHPSTTTCHSNHNEPSPTPLSLCMNSRRRKNPHDSSSNRASNRDNIAPRTTTKRTRFTKIINGDARRNEKEKSATFNSFIRVVHWSTSKLERFCVKRNWKERGGGEWNVIKTCRRVVQGWPPSRGCVVHLENTNPCRTFSLSSSPS